MANNSLSKIGGWSSGQQLTPAEITNIDEGQARALRNDSVNTLDGAAGIDTNGNTYTISGAAGSLDINGDTLNLSGGAFPGATQIVTYGAVPFSYHYRDSDWDIPALSSTSAPSHIAGVEPLFIHVHLPPNALITAFKIGAIGSTNGTLPASLLNVRLEEFGPTDYHAPSATLFTATDLSGTNAAYVVNHDITTLFGSGSEPLIQDGYSYILRCNVPSDPNMTFGARFYAPRFSYVMQEFRW